MTRKLGDWAQTFNGKAIYPLHPKPEDFDLETVAHSLALKCRFNGQCKEFYSVSQHSVIVSMFVEPQNALLALFHELDEVFLPDIPSPIKPHVNGWKEIAMRHTIAGAQAFGLTLPMPENVHYIDAAVLHTEKDILMPNSPFPWDGLPPKLDYIIKPVTWQEAEQMFLERFKALKNV